jgi:hypothetical protein
MKDLHHLSKHSTPDASASHQPKNIRFPGVDGTHHTGRDQIKKFFSAMIKATGGQAQQVRTISKFAGDFRPSYH